MGLAIISVTVKPTEKWQSDAEYDCEDQQQSKDSIQHGTMVPRRNDSQAQKSEPRPEELIVSRNKILPEEHAIGRYVVSYGCLVRDLHWAISRKFLRIFSPVSPDFSG
jgi:hypothetical protein